MQKDYETFVEKLEIGIYEATGLSLIHISHSPEEVFHPRFVEALQKQDHVEYLLDVLLFGETEEKAALITEYGKDVIQLEQRMAELAAADAARTKKHQDVYKRQAL